MAVRIRFHVLAQEGQIPSPPKVSAASTNEVLRVDVMAGVIVREERLDGRPTRSGWIVETDPYPGNPPFPFGMPV